MSDLLKLHLGSGGKNIHGFINVDCREDSNPDKIFDLDVDSKFYDEYAGKADIVYSCHILEHFREPLPILKKWYNLLRPGGSLRLSVPNMCEVVNYYLETQDLKSLKGLVWGGHKYPEDYHYHGWDEKTLSEDLKTVGFSSVEWWSWRDVEHHYVDDYSKAYLPHMDFQNGRHMSLNLEGTK